MTHKNLTAGNCFEPPTTNKMKEQQQQQKNHRKDGEENNVTAVEWVFSNWAGHEKQKGQPKQTNLYIKANKC